jgi:hypothetical protein
VAVVTTWVAKNTRKEPEAGCCPCGYRNAECDEWGEEVDDYEHRGAVVLRRVVRVHEVQLQVQCGREKGRELRRERGACGAELQRCEGERDEERDNGPESDGDGEKPARAGEEELDESLAFMHQVILRRLLTSNCHAFSSGAFSWYSLWSYTASPAPRAAELRCERGLCNAS